MRRTISIAACMALLCAGSAQAAGYEPDQVIVKYADGVSTTQRVALFDRTGVTKTLSSVSGVGAKVVSVSGDPAAVAARLNRSSLVQYAEPNLILKVDAVPNDPRFGELYGMDRIDAPEGWDAAGLGAFPASGGVKIGIVDTGIRT